MFGMKWIRSGVRMTRTPTLAVLVLACLLPSLTIAQTGDLSKSDFGVTDEDPIVLSANHVGYDTKSKKVIAEGDVEISQNLTVLLAQQVEYDETTEVITARGNVTVMESSGNVYFADEVVLTDELQRGTITYFKGRLADGSLFTAQSAQKVSETVTELKQAAYTPCSLFCKESGEPKEPSWAVTAENVKIDSEEQVVSYDDVWVEVYGQKLLYSPILSHPTPGADNKSGFLAPALQRDENLGVVAETPYYYVIDQSEDLTITPVLSSREGLLVKGDYRKKYDRGEILLSGSATAARDRDSSGAVQSGREFRGHIDSSGIYNIDDQWQAGFDLRRTTDDTFLRLYNILQNERLLTSRAYVEGIDPLKTGNDRSYFLAQSLAFQGLTAEDNQDLTPFILPLIEASHTTNPQFWGSRFTFEGSLLSLSRDEGADSNRITGGVNWNLPYTTSNGHIFEVDASLRVDGYDIDNQTLASGGEFDGTRSRFVPQISASWRYPLINELESSNVVIEPIANITASPLGLNDEEIPNEDSTLPEFNDLNLFSSNRFSGRDQLETGTRVFYGLRGLWDFYNNRSISGSVGQVYRFNDDPSSFPLSNDLSSRFSDYVGNIAVDYYPVSLNYRFRLDHDSFEPQRQELQAGANFSRFGINASYLEINDDPFLGNNEEINVGAYTRLNNYWTVRANGRRDLELARLTNAGVSFEFANECVTLLFGARRDLTNDRDINESTSVFIQLVLSHLN